MELDAYKYFTKFPFILQRDVISFLKISSISQDALGQRSSRIDIYPIDFERRREISFTF